MTSWKNRRSLRRAAKARRTRIAGVDVTGFRRTRRSHIPFTHQGYELVQPFAYGKASLLVPRFHPNELVNGEGVGDAAWLRLEAPVAFERVDSLGVVTTDYLGFISQIKVEGDRVRIEISGELSGRLGAVYRPQPVFRRVKDIGDWMYGLLIDDANQSMSPILGPVTGIRMPNRGGMSGLAWAEYLCAMSQTAAGAQRTLMPATWGTKDWRFNVKDRTTVHGTFMADGEVVVLDVSDDLLEKPNTWFAEGVSPEGGYWRNAKAPGITGGDPPAYPNDDDAPFGEGTTNAMTDSGSGVSTLHARLIGIGVLHHLESPDTTVYTAAVTDAVEAAQTGIVTRTFWDRLYAIEKAGYSLAYSRQAPILQQDQVRRWNTTPEGHFAELNPTFVRSAVRVDRPLNMGPGNYKADGVRYIRGENAKSNDKNWVGTLTLNDRHGVLEGGWTGTEPIGPTSDSILAIEDIRAGMNLWEPHFDGGTLFNVSAIDVAPDGKSATLTIDTRARDLLEVQQIMERNRESSRDIRREWIAENRPNGHSGNLITWDDEIGGILPYDKTCPGDRWTVIPIPVGQAGQINRVRLRTTPAAAYSIAVFRVPVHHKQLMARIGNPLAAFGSDDVRWWEDETKLGDWWEDRKILYHVGDNKQPCGYWPAKHTNDVGITTSRPITGKWGDDDPWPYLSAAEEPSILYLAIYPDRDTVLESGRLFYKQPEDAI